METLRPVSAAALHTIAFSSKSRHLVTGGAGGYVCVWDMKTKTESLCFTGHGTATVLCAKFCNAADEHIASCSKNAVHLHNVRSAQSVRQFQREGRSATSSVALAFGAAPHEMCVSYSDGSLSLWDTEHNSSAGGCITSFTARHKVGARTRFSKGIAKPPSSKQLLYAFS
jgi:WD40 repeat protein